jgi:hypothetical protein
LEIIGAVGGNNRARASAGQGGKGREPKPTQILNGWTVKREIRQDPAQQDREFKAVP